MSGYFHDYIPRDAHDDSPISEEDKQKDFFISEEQYNPQLMPHTGRLPEPEKFVRNMQVKSNVVINRTSTLSFHFSLTSDPSIPLPTAY